MRLNTKAILREPLLHFSALAGLLYLASHLLEDQRDRYRISVTSDEIRRVAKDYYRQHGSTPSTEQLDNLAKQYVHEEILYREGVAMGLDRQDEIIRRRIVQKVEFLEQDLSVVQDPTVSELAAYYQAHQAAYRIPERRSFTQIYFSPDRDGDARTKARALVVLSELGSNHVARAPELGDPFPGPSDYSPLSAVELSRAFGESEFSAAVPTAPVGMWSGPYRSGYGWHLLYVESVIPARIPPLSEVLDTVRSDYCEHLRELGNAEAFAKLRAKYTVILPSALPTIATRPGTTLAGRQAGAD